MKTKLEVSIEQDLASSKRHWEEVAQRAYAVMIDTGRSNRSRKHASLDFDKATKALTWISKGVRVGLITGEPI